MQESGGEDTLYTCGEMERVLARMDNPPIIAKKATISRWMRVGIIKSRFKAGAKRTCLRWIRDWLDRED